MAPPIRIRWRVRATQPGLHNPATGSAVIPAVTPCGDVLGAQTLPEQMALSAQRIVWQSTSGAVTPGISLPSGVSTPSLTLFNGEPDGGAVYLLHSIFMVVTTAGTAATNIGFCHVINVGLQSAITGLQAIRGTAGQRYRGQGVSSTGANVNDDGWEPWGTSLPVPVASLGAVLELPLDGVVALPPRHTYGILALANSGVTIRMRVGMRWSEVPLRTRK